MTVKELYDWAIENNSQDIELKVVAHGLGDRYFKARNIKFRLTHTDKLIIIVDI